MDELVEIVREALRSQRLEVKASDAGKDTSRSYTFEELVNAGVNAGALGPFGFLLVGAVMTVLSRAALHAIESSGKYRVVPVEPTEEMKEAGDDGHYGMTGAEVWSAMLAASPKVTGSV